MKGSVSKVKTHCLMPIYEINPLLISYFFTFSEKAIANASVKFLRVAFKGWRTWA